MPTSDLEELAARVGAALADVDLEGYRDLLDPGVTWGAPDDPAPACRNRDQVLAWYRQGRADGVRARVSEVVVGDESILVGLEVVRPGDAGDGTDPRWQVLGVRDGRIVDIRGFDGRDEALGRLR